VLQRLDAARHRLLPGLHRAAGALRLKTGLEAQAERCATFAARNGFAVVDAFTEVETGKGSDALDRRPQLAAALAAAKRLRCPVLVAKLDRKRRFRTLLRAA
jgi:DNA invertase Pin-like site-specific DNA recombinase